VRTARERNGDIAYPGQVDIGHSLNGNRDIMRTEPVNARRARGGSPIQWLRWWSGLAGASG
jgi:hypothetical protein